MEKVRLEIQSKFAIAHKDIVDREQALLAEVQRLLDNYIGDHIDEEFRQMNTIKASFRAHMKSVLEQSIAPLDTRSKNWIRS